MKKAFKYLCFVLIIAVFTLFDSVFFKNIRLTLSLLISFSLYVKSDKAVYIFSLSGFLCDVISKTLPSFSFLYLYISLGCVWCEKILLNISGKTVFLISFLGFLLFYFSMHIINMLTFFDVTTGFSFLFESVSRAIFNSLLSFVFYYVLKGVKFED